MRICFTTSLHLPSFSLLSTSSIAYRAIRPIAKRISPVISIWEKRIFSPYEYTPPAHSPVFIIGAPRTGSTILNQLITNHFDVTYISNLADVFYKNLPFGIYVSNKLYHSQPHQTTTSRYGNTRHLGMSAPSEGGDFWYRWLPKEKHFIDFDEVCEALIKEIRASIFSIINYWQRPFLFKNLNMGQRMRLVREITPHAKFIWIRRDPLYTAQSILVARRTLGVLPGQLWSVRPVNDTYLTTLDEIPLVVQQVYSLERQIVEDRQLFPAASFIEVTYETLCSQTEKQLDILGEFFGRNVLRQYFSSQPSPTYQDRIKISQRDFDRLTREVQQYNWRTYE